MPRKNLSVEDYRKLIEARIDRLARKTRGARAADFGYEFQEFVCVYELVKLAGEAVARGIDDIHIQTQGPSEVDDIHMCW